MSTTLTSKGQVTIPKRIRDALQLLRSCGDNDGTDDARGAEAGTGKAFLQYRRRGGGKAQVPPDFFIGAHAAVAGWPLLTRDASRFRTYFPGLQVVAP
jgi:predicted nucleic acid-binding protein